MKDNCFGVISLKECQPGLNYRVVDICIEDKQTKQRINDLGIFVGCYVSVSRKDVYGYVLGVFSGKIAIQNNLADKIMVEDNPKKLTQPE